MERMMASLAGIGYDQLTGSPLTKLCEVGARHGMEELAISPDLLASLSPKARLNLKRGLRRDLARITRPCLELERASFAAALQALGAPGLTNDRKFIDRRFLGTRLSDRLFPMFQRFPVLATLWFQLISQWHCHVTEVLSRFAADRGALSRIYFSGRPLRTIADMRCGLSDSHNDGRTVARLQFEIGSVIYKPRSGAGESEWFSFLEWINRNGFHPRLRAARVLERKGYCWMEDVKHGPCRNAAAARRFYERMGGMIAVAHLLKLVDCHRENVIASGEEPVLVDIDTLWHVSPFSKTLDAATVLYRTGFFPSANPRSLQSRSSALGPGRKGSHLPRLAGKPLKAAAHRREIIRGFARAWRSILGKAGRRDALARRLQRIRSRKRRWIYWATEKYAAISKASLQPASLRSSSERDELIRRLCSRDLVPRAVVDAEVRALKQLDIPYFSRRTSETVPSDKLPVPGKLIKAIRSALT